MDEYEKTKKILPGMEPARDDHDYLADQMRVKKEAEENDEIILIMKGKGLSFECKITKVIAGNFISQLPL